MRAVARLKLGYYPLPQVHGPMLRARLSFPKDLVTALDPCAGTGAALRALSEGANTSLLGVELDADRAAEANAAGVTTIQGNLFDVRGRAQQVSLLYLNPPYDFEIGPLANDRMERLFLAHTYEWLKIKGILVMVIPRRALCDTADALATRFKDIVVYRLTGQESEQYDQVAVFGTRHNNSGHAVEANRAMLRRFGWDNSALLSLTQTPDRMFAVPASSGAQLTYVGIPLDAVEDRLPTSQAWTYAVPLLLPKTEIAGGRPITPLHGGHVGLLATAGMLNGVFGQGNDRHIARWRPIKHTTESTEVEEKQVTVRVRERFSNELALIFADGRTCILNETSRAPEKQVAEEAADGMVARPGRRHPAEPIFEPGTYVITPGVEALLARADGLQLSDFLDRHLAGDWGDVGEDDRAANDEALMHGGLRIFSSYNVPGSAEGSVWVITEADHSLTTVLLSGES